MPGKFVAVPREMLESFLISKEFVAGKAGNEITYSRVSHNNPNAKIIVYTSLQADRSSVRGKGADAIRVLFLARVSGPDEPERWAGLHETARVYRSGSVESVMERLLERMREAYAVANTYTKVPCAKCGGCTYPDSGRCIVKACRG